jgi:hypothetical protein
MPPNPPRVLIMKAHLLEILTSGAAITLGICVWLSAKGSNSGINSLAVAGSRNYIVGFSDENNSEILNDDIGVVYCACSINGIGVFWPVGASHRSRW